MDLGRVRELVRDIPDFPRPGVVFKDLTPVFADGDAYRLVVDSLYDLVADSGVTKVAAIEARGFLVAGPVATRIGAGVVPVRKAGKLPAEVVGEAYSLEYGEDRLEVHRDAVTPGERVVLVDDVLATGGTALAASLLLERLGAKVAAVVFVLELAFLGGRARLEDRTVEALVTV